jgi:hypothetical protein
LLGLRQSLITFSIFGACSARGIPVTARSVHVQPQLIELDNDIILYAACSVAARHSGLICNATGNLRGKDNNRSRVVANSANVTSVGLITVGDPIGEGVPIGLLPIEKMPSARPTKFKSLWGFCDFCVAIRNSRWAKVGETKRSIP